MIKIICLSLIIVFFAQTKNVFSNTTLFSVDNIAIDSKNNQTKEEQLDYAFKVGFEELVKKIVVQKDLKEALNVNLNDIKNLVSSYQIVENKKKDQKIFVNLLFDRERINEFFYIKKIPYADISSTKILLFPILKKEDNFNLFAKNYFFDNWLKENKDQKKLIEYILPLESAELMQLTNRKNIESIAAEDLVSDYEIENYFILIIEPSDEVVEVFLKGKVFNNKIVKNFKLRYESNNKKLIYEDTIKDIKQEINEIWKSQNLIDVGTPTFLNITLDIKNNNDLLNLKKALNNIDIIENYRVLELNKNYAKIKIKYLGGIEKIKNKFFKEDISISIINNQWKLKLIS